MAANQASVLRRRCGFGSGACRGGGLRPRVDLHRSCGPLLLRVSGVRIECVWPEGLMNPAFRAIHSASSTPPGS